MAEEAKNSAAAHAAEIEALKRQIEEMNKRLEELSAATNADAPAEGDSSALVASAEVADFIRGARCRFGYDGVFRCRNQRLRGRSGSRPRPQRVDCRARDFRGFPEHPAD